MQPSEPRYRNGSVLLGSRGNAHWQVEGSRPIGSRVKRLAQLELMPASTRNGYCLTLKPAGLAAKLPFPLEENFKEMKKTENVSGYDRVFLTPGFYLPKMERRTLCN